MGCCLSFDDNKSKIEVINKILKGKEHNYLKLKGRIVFTNDSTYDIPKIEFDLNNWWISSVYLWPKGKKSKITFFCAKKVHIPPQISFSSKSFDGGVNNMLFLLNFSRKKFKKNALKKTIERFR